LGHINKVACHHFLCTLLLPLDSFITGFCIIFNVLLLLGTFNIVNRLFKLPINTWKMSLVSSTSQLRDMITHCVLLQPAFVTAVPCEALADGMLSVNPSLPGFLH